ncbi:MAG: putative DNA binding domain-containing protein [Fibrobacteria bacterium]|nr:putative DNA binding domain-containing protein [Fibrobacteria bacterium]
MNNSIAKPFTSTDDFKQRIRFGVTRESMYWDFKALINFEEPDKIAIDIVAFANAYGGSLLIGVSEKIGVASGLSGKVDLNETVKFINTTVRSRIAPFIHFESVPLTIDEKPVLAVNVSPQPELAGVCIQPHQHGYCYPYRTEFGNQYYQFSDVEKILKMSDSRVTYLKVLGYLKDKNQAEVTLYPSVAKIRPKRITISVLPENVNEFEICINSQDVIRLPYSMIVEIWNKCNVGEELCIQLSERIYKHGRTGGLDIAYDPEKVPAEDQLAAFNEIKTKPLPGELDTSRF